MGYSIAQSKDSRQKPLVHFSVSPPSPFSYLLLSNYFQTNCFGHSLWLGGQEGFALHDTILQLLVALMQRQEESF